MKFGKQLQDAVSPEWQTNYLDYSGLLSKLQKAEEGNTFTDTDETQFVEILDENLEKVNSFHKEQLNRIRNEIDTCVNSISSASSIPEIQEKIHTIVDDINQLEKFTRFNYTGFLKIVKKHDRLTDYVLRPMFMVRLNQCPFWKEMEEHDALLIKLSLLFSQIRGNSQLSMSFQPSTSLLRESILLDDAKKTRTVVKRFFVHVNDVLELKTTVLRYLPVIVYRNGTRGQREEEDIDPPISSLYLDNENLDTYCSRVESAPGSQIIRIRWYGTVEKNRSISIERRTTEDESRGELRDRFNIKEKYVDSFLKGEATFIDKQVNKMKENGRNEEEIKNFKELATSIQNQIVKNKMQPVLRTYYKRTAFQIPGDNSVRMALDTDLCFIREDSGLFANDPVKRRPGESWRRPDVDINFPFKNLTKDVEVNRYAYATFEIKLCLAPHENEPKWVLDLEKSGLIEEAHHFSKFVHGVAIMFENRVPLLPFWLAQIDEDRKMLPIVDEEPPLQLDTRQDIQSYGGISSYVGASTSTVAAESSSSNPIMGHIKGLLTMDKQKSDEIHSNLPPGVKVPKKVDKPLKVEPKVFFANERTYFSWMSFGTMLSTFSLALFNSGDTIGKISAILYTLIAVSTLIYGAGLYYRRRELIKARLPGPYDDLIGPTLICFSLLIAVGMNAYLKFTSPESEA